MDIVDPAARWDPLPQERPSHVWLPAQRPAAPAGGPPAAATPRPPRSLVLTLTPQQAADLPLELARLVRQQDVGPGDRVTVDLADLAAVHLTGLQLLLTVLWRRVAADGEVLLTGGTRGLRAQLSSLGLTPAACRTAVFGPPAPPAVPPALVPRPSPTGLDASRPAPLPQQRRPQDVQHPPRSERPAR